LQARYTQGFAVFAPITSKALVNSHWNKVVNIASTKMLKKIFGMMIAPSRRHSGAMQSIEPQMRNCTSGNLEIPGSRYARPGMTTEF
jgi:hypothetical protein